MKKRAILLLRLFGRLRGVVDSLLADTDFVLLADTKLAGIELTHERFVPIDSVVDVTGLRKQARAEVAQREAILWDYFQEHLVKLPYAEHFPEAGLQRLRDYLRVIWEVAFQYTFIAERLAEQYDLRCVVCAPSFIVRHSAALAVFKDLGIPTVHLQHGSVLSSEIVHPEMCDLVFVSDEFGVRTLDEWIASDMKAVATGMPFCLPCRDEVLDEAKDKVAQQEARKKLGLAAQGNVILYANSWTTSAQQFSNSHHVYLDLESFERVIAFAKERTEAGKPTHILVRQHPTNKHREHIESYSSLAYDYGFESGLSVDSSDKESALIACDMVTSPYRGTSFYLEAFAYGRPVVALGFALEIAHYYAFSQSFEFMNVAYSDAQLKRQFERVLDDRDVWRDKVKRALEFMKEVRTVGSDEASDNIQRLIREISEQGLQGVTDRLPPRRTMKFVGDRES